MADYSFVDDMSLSSVDVAMKWFFAKLEDKGGSYSHGDVVEVDMSGVDVLPVVFVANDQNAHWHLVGVESFPVMCGMKLFAKYKFLKFF